MKQVVSVLGSHRALKGLCAALVLILVSGLGASAVESSGYSVEVRDIKMSWARMAAEIRANASAYGKEVEVTFDGSNGSLDMSASPKQIAFKLLVPKRAKTGAPVPGIVCTHGFYNNKEMQDAYYVELARRGYAVAVVDMAGHGGSDVTFAPEANIIQATENSGMEACLEWLMSQPYVDETKMGVTGHSQGGRTCGWTIQHLMRAGKEDYVKAYLGQANSAGLTAVLGEFGRFPDHLTTGTIMCRYDEFSIVRDNSYDYMSTAQAKALISAAFPGFSDSAVEHGRFYTAGGPVQVDTAAGRTLEGRGAVVYWPPITHPWAHFSSRCSGYASEFFYASLGVPAGAAYIDPGSQVWQWKELFNLLGLVGFFLLIVPLARLLLELPVFRPLAAGAGRVNDGLVPFRGARVTIPFWASGLLTVFITAAIFQPIYSGSRLGNAFFPPSPAYPQTSTNTIAMWTAACGLVGLGLTLLFWGVRRYLHRKDPGWSGNPFAPARLESVSQFFTSLLLAFTTAGFLYLVVWAQYLVWGVDFRFWTLAVMPFELVKAGAMLRYLPFFLLFYVVNALCCANNRFRGMAEWKSVALTCLFNVAGIAVLLAIQYHSMVFLGRQANWLLESPDLAIGGALGYLLLIPIFFVLIASNITARKLYLLTGSVWVGGLLNGILFTAVICANTFAQYGYVLAA